MNSTAGNEIEIVVKVNDQASAQAAAIAAKVRGQFQAAAGEPMAAPAMAEGEHVQVPVEADAKGLHEEIKEEVAKAEAGEEVKIRVDVDTGDSVKKLAAVEAESHAVSRAGNDLWQDSAGRWRNSAGQFASAAEQSEAGLRDFGDAADSAGTRADQAGDKARSGGKKADDGGSGWTAAAGRIALLASAALALGPALAAIPAVLGAVGAGGATLAAGLGGVIGALKDSAAQSAATGQSSAQLAQTEFQDAVAIRNAQQSITDAKRQAAIAQQNSADAVASAQEHLAQAQDAEQLATQALTQAWKDAANTLQDLNNSAADATNGVADAQLALQQAQENAQKVTQSSLSTDLQKKQALQQLKDAQQALADAQQRQKEAQQAADDANAKGIAGSTQVTAAQRAQKQAVQSVADAQHALIVAQRNAADQQQASAEAIQKAVQNLADTYKQQQLAAAAAAASGSSAANKFQQDMAKLTPAGRALVDQLLAMKSSAHELAATAQTSMLPGLTTMLKDSSPLLPIFNTAIQNMGGVVGGTAVQLGNLMKSSAFQGQLTQVLKDAAGFAKDLGDGFVKMAGGLTQAAAKAGPIVSGLGGGFKDLMGSGIPAFFSGLATQATDSGKGLHGILDIVSNLLGPIGQLAGIFSGALGPALLTLAPAIGTIATALVQDLLPVMLTLAPAIGTIATALVQDLLPVMLTLSDVLQSVAGWIAQNTNLMTPLVGGILLAVAAVKTWNTMTSLATTLQGAWTAAMKLFTAESIAAQIATKAWSVVQAAFNLIMDANPIILVGLAIAGLVTGVIYAWDHFKGFRDFIKQMWSDIEKYFSIAGSYLLDFWKHELQIVKDIWAEIHDNIVNPIVDAYHTVVHWFDTAVTYVKGLPAKLASAGAHMWDWISQGVANISGTVSTGFHSFINDLIQGINWAIKYVNEATNTISDAWTWIPGASGSGIPPIPDIPLWKALGGPTGTGLTGFGERGIEIARLPNGSVVVPHANTMSAFQGGGFGRPQTPPRLEWIGPAGDEFFAFIRRYVRVNYGTGPDAVQRAFGQSW